MVSLNILHVIQTLNPRHGGPVSALWGLAYAQAMAGNRVSIYTTITKKKQKRNWDNTKNTLTKDDAITIHCAAAYTPLLLSSAFISLLRRMIEHFDILHIHGLYRFPVTYAAWLARKTGIPYIIRPHGSLDPFLYQQSRFGKMALPLKRMYERLFDIPNLNNAAAIHYTTKEEMERASFLGLRAKPALVPMGIDWESYRYLPAKGSFRRRLGLKNQTPLVLFLGRINFKKGLDLLVPAFSQVLQEAPQARLAIVGPDNEGYGLKVRRWCQEQSIEDKTFFVDHLGPEEVKQAYVDADVFVLPSYTENFGMTIIEAMACGCPVVISDQVNIWREVKEAGAAMVTSIDPAEIAPAIRRVLKDRELARAMGARGRAEAENRYSWPKIVDRLTEIYQMLINEAASRRRKGRD